ncbi:MAG: indole-3-glycerol phosphate synthase TrpC [Tannerella sp.]|jgi:indole-3-glycerol phosphate synthase|nr:indole-3-glycerol phosphate synthase TrpC [Tannerella sp.]
MMDILETIISHKRKEVAERKESLPLDKLLKTRELQFERKTNSMLGALKRSPSGIIAEFKRKSPSKGWLFPDAKVEEIVPAYESGGASVCSVLTDYEFFGGSLSDLERARELVRLPLLRKDFIVDEYQIYEARAAGADAILLIATVLQPVECIKLARMACKLHLQVLLEIHTPEELNRLNPYIDMVGVNNRNLGTFHTDVNNSFRLMEHIQRELGDDPAFRLFVSESGLSDIQTIHELRNVGFRGFLIGETLMKTPDPGKTLKELILELDEKK